MEEKKGEDIALLDVREISTITDYVLLVSGGSPPHLKAMYNEAQVVLKGEGVQCYRRAGDPASGWMTLDYVDAVAHIFMPETREYYAIETLWEEAPRRNLHCEA